MKVMRNLALGAVLLIGGTVTASASTISFTDTFNPADVYFNSTGGNCTGNNASDTVSGYLFSACNSLTFTHTLSGYNAGTDTLSAASLALTFYDDSSFDGTEKVVVIADSYNHTYNLTSGGTSNISINVLANLLDGVLNVSLSDSMGDFYFASSTLTASGTRADAPINNNPVNDPNNATVPEPTSIIGLGTGLVALARRFRKA